MNPLIFSLPGNEGLADSLCRQLPAERGDYEHRRFPDGEFYLKIASSVKDRIAVLVSSLNDPDQKLAPLFFLASALRDLKASRIVLLAPYLAYLRQDTRFHEGEGITSAYFARFLSSFLDGLVTVDPHLHRYASLSEIYSIPTFVVHAAPRIAEWIEKNVARPFLIGPDRESEQWVAEVAERSGAPFTVLSKVRKGDQEVAISVPDLAPWKDRTPVLIDDIISTGRTLANVIRELKNGQIPPPVCIGVHAVFAGNAYEDLLAAGAGQVVTCNTIVHPSNEINLTESLGTALRKMLHTEDGPRK